MERRQIKSKDLSFGDIIILKTPYEENTKDYYHGYNVLDVMGDYVRDGHNRTQKCRPVLVIATENDELIYTPITSKHNMYKEFDIKNHYRLHEPLQNNKNYTTYVQTLNVRAVDTKDYYNYEVIDTLKPRDKQAILGALVNTYTEKSNKMDTRRFVTPKHKRKFENQLTETGFEKNQNKYTKDNLEITISDKGIIKYHYNYTLDEVREKHNSPLCVNKENNLILN